jgi:hypothetical protein
MTFALPDTTSDQPSCRFTRSTASAVFAIDARSPPASSLAIVASSPTAIASAFVGVARGAHRSRLRGVTYEHGEPGGRDANALPAFRLPLRVILAWRSSSVLAERSQQRRVCQQACLGKNTSRTPARTPRGKSTRERGRGSLRGTFSPPSGGAHDEEFCVAAASLVQLPSVWCVFSLARSFGLWVGSFAHRTRCLRL